MTERRQQDIQQLRDELKQQSDQTEAALGRSAQTFNQLAEQLKQTTSVSPPPSDAPSVSTDEADK